jgi:hypothetical protein
MPHLLHTQAARLCMQPGLALDVDTAKHSSDACTHHTVLVPAVRVAVCCVLCVVQSTQRELESKLSRAVQDVSTQAAASGGLLQPLATSLQATAAYAECSCSFASQPTDQQQQQCMHDHSASV